MLSVHILLPCIRILLHASSAYCWVWFFILLACRFFVVLTIIAKSFFTMNVKTNSQLLEHQHGLMSESQYIMPDWMSFNSALYWFATSAYWSDWLLRMQVVASSWWSWLGKTIIGNTNFDVVTVFPAPFHSNEQELDQELFFSQAIMHDTAKAIVGKF